MPDTRSLSGQGKDQCLHHISDHHNPIRQVHGRNADHQAPIVPPWRGPSARKLIERHIRRSSAKAIIHLTMEAPLMAHLLYRLQHHVLPKSRRINRDMLTSCHPGNSARTQAMTHRGCHRLLMRRGTAASQLLGLTLGYPPVAILAMMTRLNLIRQHEGHIVRGSEFDIDSFMVFLSLMVVHIHVRPHCRP